MQEEPKSLGGFWAWTADEGEVAVRFVGRGPDFSRVETLRRLEEDPPPSAWARQVHSARSVVVERPGRKGRADALVTDLPRLALAVSTADCVPILLAAGDRIAAAHAGWRGIVGGVVLSTLEDLGRAPDARAWLGPAIGPCCYEVGPDVAAEIASASSEEVVCRPRERPHIDLVAAVRHQLSAAGITDHRVVQACTRCRPEWLWSYRRDGEDAGRNLAFVWRR